MNATLKSLDRVKKEFDTGIPITRRRLTDTLNLHWYSIEACIEYLLKENKIEIHIKNGYKIEYIKKT